MEETLRVRVAWVNTEKCGESLDRSGKGEVERKIYGEIQSSV